MPTTPRPPGSQGQDTDSASAGPLTDVVGTWERVLHAGAQAAKLTWRRWRLEAGMRQGDLVARVREWMPPEKYYSSTLSIQTISRYEHSETDILECKLRTLLTFATITGHPSAELFAHIDHALQPYTALLLGGTAATPGTGSRVMTREQRLLQAFRRLPPARQDEFIAFMEMMANSSAPGGGQTMTAPSGTPGWTNRSPAAGEAPFAGDDGLASALAESDAWLERETESDPSSTMDSQGRLAPPTISHHGRPHRRRISNG